MLAIVNVDEAWWNASIQIMESSTTNVADNVRSCERNANLFTIIPGQQSPPHMSDWNLWPPSQGNSHHHRCLTEIFYLHPRATVTTTDVWLKFLTTVPGQQSPPHMSDWNLWPPSQGNSHHHTCLTEIFDHNPRASHQHRCEWNILPTSQGNSHQHRCLSEIIYQHPRATVTSTNVWVKSFTIPGQDTITYVNLKSVTHSCCDCLVNGKYNRMTLHFWCSRNIHINCCVSYWKNPMHHTCWWTPRSSCIESKVRENRIYLQFTMGLNKPVIVSNQGSFSLGEYPI